MSDTEHYRTLVDQIEIDRTLPRVRVLVLDEEPPFPPDAGKRIRTWNLLKELAPRHEITYVCYAKNASDAQQALQDAGIKLIAVPPRRLETGIWLYLRLFINCFSSKPFSVSKHNRRRFHRKITQLMRANRYDLIHCEWTPYAQFAVNRRSGASQTPGQTLSQTRGPVPVLIASHNIEAEILHRRADQQNNPIGRRYFEMQAARMERFEKSVFSQAQVVTAVSEHDRQLAQAWGAHRTSLVANGVATDTYQPGHKYGTGDNRELLFLGSLDWFPNVDALRYFLSDIFPSVRMRDPRITLTVVGRRPDARLRKLINGVEGTSLTGDVPDVRPFLERAAAIVVPLRIGGGTRIKILEAMATGKIVVATTIGAEGLDIRHGVDLLIADSPSDFAAAIESALDPIRSEGMPQRARERVEQLYSWRRQAKALETCWFETALNGRPEGQIALHHSPWRNS